MYKEARMTKSKPTPASVAEMRRILSNPETRNPRRTSPGETEN
jgi:hypothetical protein